MKRMIFCALLTCSVVALSGCSVIDALLSGNRTTVTLVNSGTFDVDVTIAISDIKDIPEDVLRQLGTETRFTVVPGGVMSFSRDCSDLRALMVKNAKLKVVGSVGPETHTGVLRSGSDFECGNTITFTFSNSSSILDFKVQTDIR